MSLNSINSSGSVSDQDLMSDMASKTEVDETQSGAPMAEALFLEGQGTKEFSAADVSEISVSSTRFLADANYRMAGDDLIVTGANGEVIIVSGWMSADIPPTFVAEDGGVLDAEIITTLALNGTSNGSATAQMGGAVPFVQVGIVDNISGDVSIIRSGGEQIALKVGDPIYQDDEIITGADGVVGFIFSDKSTFSIGEDARMIVDEFVYDPETASGSIDMHILKGAFTFASGLIADSNPTNMVMTTPQAVIGIRGTAGGGFVNPDGESEFFNTEGAISVTTDAGVAVIDRPLEVTRVQSRNEPPSEPELSNVQNLASKFSKVLESSPSSSASMQRIFDSEDNLDQDNLDQNDSDSEEENTSEEDTTQTEEEAAAQEEDAQIAQEDATQTEEEAAAQEEDAQIAQEDATQTEEEAAQKDATQTEEETAQKDATQTEEEAAAQEAAKDTAPTNSEQSYLIENSDSVQKQVEASETTTRDVGNTDPVVERSFNTVNVDNEEAPTLLPRPSGEGAFSVGDGSINFAEVKSVILSGEANSVYASSTITIVLSDSHGNTETITTTAETDGSFSVNADMSSLLGGDISARLTSQAVTGQVLENTAVAFMQTASVTSYSESNAASTLFSEGDGITNTNLGDQEITGLGVPESQVIVTLTGDNNETHVTNPITVGSDGTWSTKDATWNSDISQDASYTVSVTPLDSSGNVGEAVQASKALTIDTSAPTLDLSANSSMPHYIGGEIVGVSTLSTTKLVSEENAIADGSNISKIVLSNGQEGASGSWKASDVLTLNGTTLSTGNGTVTVGGEEVNYSLSSGGTLTLSGDWTPEQANTILNSLSFGGADSSLDSRRFDIKVEDAAGNVSEVATSVVRLKELPTLDLGSGVGADHKATALLTSEGDYSSTSSGASTFIANPNMTVTGSADSIILSSDGAFILADGTDLATATVSIGNVNVNVTQDTSNSPTTSVTITSADGEALTADEIEAIVRDIRYSLTDNATQADNATQDVTVTLRNTVGGTDHDVTSTSTIDVIATSNLDLSGTDSKNGRAVSAADANTGGVSVGDQTALSSGSTVESVTFTLSGIQTGDRLIETGALTVNNISDVLKGKDFIALLNLNNNHRAGLDTSIKYGGDIVKVSMADATKVPPTFTLTFTVTENGSDRGLTVDEFNSFINGLQFKAADGEGGRSIQIDANVLDSEGGATTHTSVFEVLPGGDNMTDAWDGWSTTVNNDTDLQALAVGSGLSTLDSGNGYDTVILNYDGAVNIPSGITNVEAFIGSDNHAQAFNLTALPDGVEYKGGGNENPNVTDSLVFADTTSNRVIDLSTIDKVVGTVDGFELIDLSNNTVDTLKLNSEAVVALTDAKTSDGKALLTVNADDGDTVDLGNEFVDTGTTTDGGYSVYESDEAVVYVSTGAEVTGLL